MKIRFGSFFFILFAGLFASVAFAQDAGAPAKGSQASGQSAGQTAGQASEQPAALKFTGKAAAIAVNTEHLDLNGYIAVYIDQSQWASLLKDKDAGPFVKLKEAKPGRTLVMLISDPSKSSVAVFFDGDAPISMVALKPGESASAASLKDVPKDAQKDPGQKLRFEPATIASDDGDPLPAYGILLDKNP